MKETIKYEISTFRKNSNIDYVASVDDDGYPQIKAMLVLEHDSVQKQYFSTNLSSKRA